MTEASQAKRIWFLEDEPADFELVRHQLERQNFPFTLQQITTEQQFREGMHQAPPDLILSDRGLPGFDGFSALDTCRRERPQLPFIFVTGSLGPEAINMARERGATNFIPKSQLPRLGPAVRNALGLDGHVKNLPNRLLALVNAAPDAIWTMNREGLVLDWNPAAERILGHTAAEAIGLNWTELLFPGDHQARRRQALYEELAVLEKTWEPHSLDLMARGAEGQLIPVEVTLTRLTDEEPPVFAGYLRNISQRRRAEAALRKSEERFRLAVEGVAEYGIYLLDEAGRVVTWNAGAERITGYRAEEIVGQSFSRFFTPEDMACGMPDRELREASTHGATRNERWCVRKDGSRYLSEWVMTAVREHDGQLTGFLRVTHDVTQRRKAEGEIARLNAELEARVARRTAQLEAANRELEAFSYSVSHDLRAPLRHITGFAELLQQSAAPHLEATQRDFLRIILESAGRMNKLIDALLSFSRTARMPLHKTNVSLEHLIGGVLRDLRYDLSQRHVEWVIHPLPEVHGDGQLLRIVLTNLVSNALKYTRTRSIARIEIGARTEGREVVIFVRDNGIGFDMMQADKLFGVFQRLHSATEYEGTGVGLANVRRIVQRHGGRAWAEGHVDAGATFYFALPAASEPAEGAANAP